MGPHHVDLDLSVGGLEIELEIIITRWYLNSACDAVDEKDQEPRNWSCHAAQGSAREEGKVRQVEEYTSWRWAQWPQPVIPAALGRLRKDQPPDSLCGSRRPCLFCSVEVLKGATGGTGE